MRGDGVVGEAAASGGRGSVQGRPGPRLHYAWVMMALTFLAMLVASGVRSAPAVFIAPLEAEFGWSRSVLSAPISLTLFSFGLAAPLTGWLIDRWGTRIVMVGSMLLCAVGMAGTVFVSAPWQLMPLWGVLVGFGAGAGASVTGAAVANRWFLARRGLAIGILNSAPSTGQLIFLPALMAVLVVSDWRTAVLLMAAAAVLLVPLLIGFARDDPSQLGLGRYGEPGPLGQQGSGERPAEKPSVNLCAAWRSQTFWYLAGSYFVCGATSAGLIGTHLVPYGIDRGFPPMAAGVAIGVMGGMNFVGTIFSGWMTDRVDPRRVLAAVYLMRGVTLVMLPLMTSVPGLVVWGVLYGLYWFATVPPTIALTADAFGRGSMATIYGWIFLSHQLGASFSAVMAGAVRDWLGDYQPAFWGGALLTVVAALLALLVQRRDAPHVEQTVPA